MKYEGIIKAKIKIHNEWDDIVFNLDDNVINYLNDSLTHYSNDEIVGLMNLYEKRGHITYDIKPIKELKKMLW